MKLNYGGIVPISTIEWPGRDSSVIFFRGCSFRCIYCHNKELQNGEDHRDIDFLKKFLTKTRPFISAVVFSGGEPAIQYEALKILSEYARELDLDIGIYTNGYYPDVIEKLYLKNRLDKIFLSIKAPLLPRYYKQITQLKDRYLINKILKTIETLKKYKIDSDIIIPLHKSQTNNIIKSYYQAYDIIKSINNLKCCFIIQNIEGCEQKYTRKELKNIGTWLKETYKYHDIRIRTKEKGMENI